MLLRNVIVNYAGTGWAVVVSLAFIPVYIRYLGLEAYGLVGIFAILVAALGLLDLGIAPTISREMARFSAGKYTAHGIRQLLRSLEIVLIFTGGIVILMLFLSAGWLAASWVNAENLSEKEIALSIVLMGCVIALRFLEGLYRASLQGLQKQVQANALNAGFATIRALGAWAALAWIAPSIGVFFLWQIIASILSVIAHAFAIYRSLPEVTRPVHFSKTALNLIANFASGVMGITFLAILLTQVDKIILSKMLLLSDYAVYAVAASVSVSIYNLATPITTAFYPRMAQLLADGDTNAARMVFHSGAKALSVIAGSIALTLAILAEPVLRVWTNDAALARQAAPLLTLLMIGSLLNMFMQMPYHAQLARGQMRIILVSNVVAVIVIIPLLIVMTAFYGSVGAAAVWCILNLGYLFLAAPLIFRQSMPGSFGPWMRDELVRPLIGPVIILTAGLWLFPHEAGRLFQAAILLTLVALALVSSGLVSGYWRAIKQAVTTQLN